MNDEDTTYLVERLRRVVELLKGGEVHMVIAKLNADISALSTPDSEHTPYDYGHSLTPMREYYDAAQRQDAMLERRDALEALVSDYEDALLEWSPDVQAEKLPLLDAARRALSELVVFP